MAFLKSKGGKTVTLGTIVQSDGSIVLDTTESEFGRTIYTNVDARELRDALLEAFPLECSTKPEFDAWAELSLPVAEKPRYAPGTVLRNGGGDRFVTLPDDKLYSLQLFEVLAFSTASEFSPHATVIFDARTAVALHNPLAKFRIGDTATKVVDGVTTSFKVQHIDRAGFIGPNSDYLLNPRDYSSDREQLDRLPAGTIVRLLRYGLRLITGEGAIHLTGHVNPNPEFRDGSDYGVLVKRGDAEVIYLP